MMGGDESNEKEPYHHIDIHICIHIHYHIQTPMDLPGSHV
jgi:hypothetical protein